MIPLPPPDPGLPGLATALDGEAVARALTAHFPEVGDGGFEVLSCDPHYVRYKPGTNCVVQYALVVGDACGAVTELPAHAQLFADDRASRRWRRAKLQRLLEDAGKLHPSPPIRRAALAPDLPALVCLYPIDYDLRSLTWAASTPSVRGWLHSRLPANLGQLVDASPTLIRYKPGRKALLRFALTGGGANAVYAKVIADERSERLMEACQALLGAGIATALPVASCAEKRLIFHAEAPGVPLASLEGENELGRWVEPTANALARLHEAHVPNLNAHRLTEEAETIWNLARSLGVLLPPLAPRLENLAASLADALIALPEVFVPVHGDFYTDQVLVSASGVVLIDLDEIRLGHPLLDVGMFLAHLTAAPDGGASRSDARAEFQRAYARLKPATCRDVAIFEAAALMRRAMGPFRRLEPDWPDGVERIVRLAEDALDRSRIGRSTAVARATRAKGPIVDPSLPQLERLTDSAAMAQELSLAWGGSPVMVRTIAVVRHKPGRRCLLRYDLEFEGQEQRLYAKTFASQRGQRVYEIAREIAEARAFGPDVTVPVPVGFLPHLKVLLQREIPGDQITPHLLAGDVTLAQRIAEALHAFHGSNLDLGRLHTLDDEIAPLRDRVEQIAQDAPLLAAAARRCLDLVHTNRPSDEQWRRRPCHRDCYPEQFLIGSDGLAVLDLDDAAMSEPAVDIANVLAHLRLLGLQQRGDPGALDEVSAAFREASCRLDPALRPDLIWWLHRATLLRLAAIHLPRARGEWIASRLLDEAQAGRLCAESWLAV